MADVILTRRQILLLAAEATYGADAAPNEASSFQAIRLIDPFVLDLGQEMVEVAGGNLTRGFSRPIATVRPAGITFRSYMVGIPTTSYAASVKPPLADALRACALQEVFTAALSGGPNASYRYDPTVDVSSDISVTIVAHQDGKDHRLLGCRGNVNLIFPAGAPVIAEFTYRGILSTEAETTRSAPTGLPTVVPPRWIGSGSVYVQSLQSLVENLNFNTNNTVFEQRASLATSGSGIAAVIITDRQPGGSFDPEAVVVSSYDFFAAWRATSGATLRMQVGATEGNRFTLIGSQTVLKRVAWADKSGMGIFAVDFQSYERASNDEYRLTFD